jgi:hypothetical protein
MHASGNKRVENGKSTPRRVIFVVRRPRRTALGNPAVNQDMDAQACQPVDVTSTRGFPCALAFTFHVAFPIAIGAAIYLLFRTTSLLVFEWLRAVSLFELTLAARRLLSGISLPKWLLYSLPDGLWVYAVTSWMILIWDRNPPLLWLFVGVALGVGGEVGQAISIVPGTFQHLDVIFYVAGFLAAYFDLEYGHETSRTFPVGIARNDPVRVRKRGLR